jgi:predicted ATP-dependent endonuclease of OLD family
MSVKITEFEIERFKRIKAVAATVSQVGLTTIGGNNRQGKTSALDGLCYALGGEKYRPTNIANDGSAEPPYIRVELSNGIVAERKGKNSALTVTDKNGRKGGQQLLDAFKEDIALDLSKFMNAKPTERAKMLLKLIGVGNKLESLDLQESKLYAEREAQGRVADQKKKFAAELPWVEEAPTEPLSAAELLAKHQEILQSNARNADLRRRKAELAATCATKANRVDELKLMLQQAEKDLAQLRADHEAAIAPPESEDKNTAEIQANIDNIEKTNNAVRGNKAKLAAQAAADSEKAVYDGLTIRIENVRAEKLALLSGVKMPLDDLSIENGELLYCGKAWDCMSGAEQLIVATSMARAMKPECGFVLIDGIEQMDLDTLRTFGMYLEMEGMQAIATRVSKGEECTIIIEDGEVAQ